MRLRTRYVALLLAALLAPEAARAQRPVADVWGRVTDSAGTPLPDARVRLLELGRTVLTGHDGVYRFRSVAVGTLTLSITRVGHVPETRRLDVVAPATRADVAMRETRLQLAAVQVTASAGATRAQDSPQPTAVLEGAELRTAQGAALGETLEQVPGVRSLTSSSRGPKAPALSRTAP